MDRATNREIEVHAFDELSDRALGEHCWLLISELMLQETARFDSEHREELGGRLAAFVAHLKRDPSRLDAARERMHSPTELGAWLRVCIRRWLIDEFRKTDTGSLGWRLTAYMRRHANFARVEPGETGAGNWYDVRIGPEPWDGDADRVRRALRTIQLTTVGKSRATQRRPRIASNTELELLLARLFAAAGGSMPIGDVTVAVMQRCSTVTGLPTVPRCEASEFTSTSATEPSRDVREIFDALTDAERIGVAFLGRGDDGLSAAWGVDQAEMRESKLALTRKLAALLAATEVSEATGQLLELCERFVGDHTT